MTEHKHIEALPVPDFEDEPQVTMLPQPHGGELKAGNTQHGLGFRSGPVSPRLRREMDKVRDMLRQDFGDVMDGLSLPTIERLCMAASWSNLCFEVIEEYAFGGKTRKERGVVLSGVEAVPQWIADQFVRSTKLVAELSQDLGLDLTGRVKALKDDAIRATLTGGGNLASFAADGRKLRQLRGRGA